jgi:uncharacterized protein YbjT (DUF2867 family)
VIGVLGATGITGGAVLGALARHAIPAVAIVRGVPTKRDAFPAGTTFRVADTHDVTTCIAALEGVRTLYLVMANGPDQRADELVFVHAAVRAGVEHVIKLSAPVVGPDVPVAVARMHGEIEAVIETSGLAHTHVRPYAFMSNLLRHARTIVSMGVVFGCTGHAKVNFVSPDDIADVVVTACTDPALRGRALVLTGPEAYEMAEVAHMLKGLGIDARYVDQTPAAHRRGLARANLPPWLVEHILEIQALSVAAPERPTETVADVLGRPPRTLEAFLGAHREVFLGERPFVGRIMGRALALHGAIDVPR